MVDMGILSNNMKPPLTDIKWHSFVLTYYLQWQPSTDHTLYQIRDLITELDLLPKYETFL